MKKYLIGLIILSFTGCVSISGKVYNKRVDNVVTVRTERGAGTGVYIDKFGTILTCAHIVKDVKEISISEFDSSLSFEYKILKVNEIIDLALLSPITSRKIKHYSKIIYKPSYVGQKVYSIGHPLGLTWTISEGIISANYRIFPIDPTLQVTILTLPGSSGSPVYDRKGRLIGLIRAVIPFGLGATQLSYAIPLETIVKFLEPKPTLKDIK